MERAIKEAKDKFKVQEIFTGALASVYQKSRVEKICDKLKLKCLSPLWQQDQFELLRDIVTLNFDVILTGVFAFGLDNFIGRKIDSQFIGDIRKVHQKYKINPAGEGGEFETFVMDAPFFKKKIEIVKSHIVKDKEKCNILMIDQIRFIEKSL